MQTITKQHFEEPLRFLVQDELILNKVSSSQPLALWGGATSHGEEATLSETSAPTLEVCSIRKVLLEKVLCEDLSIQLPNPPQQNDRTMVTARSLTFKKGGLSGLGGVPVADLTNLYGELLEVSDFAEINLKHSSFRELRLLGGTLKLDDTLLGRLHYRQREGEPEIHIHFDGNSRVQEAQVFLCEDATLMVETLVSAPSRFLLQGYNNEALTLRALDGLKPFRTLDIQDLRVTCPDPFSATWLNLRDKSTLNASCVTLAKGGFIGATTSIKGGRYTLLEGSTTIIEGRLEDVRLEVRGSLRVNGTLRNCVIETGDQGHVEINDPALLQRSIFI